MENQQMKLWALFGVYKDPDYFSQMGFMSVHLSKASADAASLVHFRSYRAHPHANQWEETRLREQTEETRRQVDVPKILYQSGADAERNTQGDELNEYEYVIQEIFAS